MAKFAITKKIGMTRIFDQNGKHVAVTLLSGQSGVVKKVKSADSSDGYDAIVVEVPSAKKNQPAKQYEFRVDSILEYKIGMEINVALFDTGDSASVIGTGKGKGFAGTIKRHGFHRGPKSHGSHNVRQPGSIGGGYPQRVVPGKKMAGRMGGHSVVTKNLKIMDVDKENNIIAVSGSVPGAVKSTVKLISK